MLTPGTAASPVVAVVGDDFAYGLGDDLRTAFPEQLGSYIGDRVVVSADTGAGYVNPEEGAFGPFSALVANLDLPRLRPSIVIVQGGYNDADTNPFTESAAVGDHQAG